MGRKSIYRRTREANFIKDLIKDFKGVLVTDFYNGYDAVDFPQQRCLIHLIRDLNSDLIRNPFNEEFKEIVKLFTTLLQEMVFTINRFGPKKVLPKEAPETSGCIFVENKINILQDGNRRAIPNSNKKK